MSTEVSLQAIKTHIRRARRAFRARQPARWDARLDMLSGFPGFGRQRQRNITYSCYRLSGGVFMVTARAPVSREDGLLTRSSLIRTILVVEHDPDKGESFTQLLSCKPR
jgi:hypothetical protein